MLLSWTLLLHIVLLSQLAFGYPPLNILTNNSNDNDFKFNHTRTYELTKKQVDLGPRYPGSIGIEKTRHLIASELNSSQWSINFQNFSKVWISNQRITLVNIICRPKAYDLLKPAFLLLAHYDTRLEADNDPNFLKRNQPVIGANDGASGVAMVLELGRMLLDEYKITNFQLVFFDGEDQGKIGDWEYLVGSTYYADSREFSSQKLSFGILFDMVGGKNAEFKREKNSDKYASEIVSLIWNEADTLGYNNYFINSSGLSITDDHIPLLKKGLPAIDIIDDFRTVYKPWHTTFDNMTYISEETFKAVGYTVESVLSRQGVLSELLLNSPRFTFVSPIFFISCLNGIITLIYVYKKSNSSKIRK